MHALLQIAMNSFKRRAGNSH